MLDQCCSCSPFRNLFQQHVIFIELERPQIWLVIASVLQEWIPPSLANSEAPGCARVGLKTFSPHGSDAIAAQI